MAGILIALVILLPWFGALFVWLARNERPKLQHTLAVLFSVRAAIASLILLGYASAEPAIQIPLGNAFGVLTFVPDGLGVTLTAIATVIGSLAVIFSVDYMHGDEQLGRYYFLVLFFIGAMTGLVLSGNLLFTFFFWEITALCSYGLISFYNDDPKGGGRRHQGAHHHAGRRRGSAGWHPDRLCCTSAVFKSLTCSRNHPRFRLLPWR